MRVLVTRPLPEAETTAGRLAALGHEALVAPLFRAEAVAARLDTAGAAALALTSARTVGFLPASLIAVMRGRPAFAIGDRTADALAVAGFRDLHSADGDVRDLARLVVSASLPLGSRVLSPGGETRAGDLGAVLSEAGLRLDQPVLYRMVAASGMPPPARDALDAGRLDAALHYSPIAAAVFLRLTGQASRAAGLLHVCLSEAVAAPLRAAGWPRLVVAAAPREEALLAALAG